MRMKKEAHSINRNLIHTHPHDTFVRNAVIDSNTPMARAYEYIYATFDTRQHIQIPQVNVW